MEDSLDCNRSCLCIRSQLNQSGLISRSESEKLNEPEKLNPTIENMKHCWFYVSHVMTSSIQVANDVFLCLYSVLYTTFQIKCMECYIIVNTSGTVGLLLTVISKQESKPATYIYILCSVYISLHPNPK